MEQLTLVNPYVAPNAPNTCKKLVKVTGHYKMEIVREGKIIHTEEGQNGIVDVGFNKIIDVMFGNVTQITAWYIGFVDNASFTGLNAGDTMASHSGWTEATGYSGNRKQWTPATAASKATQNSSAASFTMSGSATLKGIFVTSQVDKTLSTGTLWASAPFTTTYAVINGDVINITYGLAFSEV